MKSGIMGNKKGASPFERWQRFERVMAMFAHCDDVELRMGGTFARLVREGRRVAYVVAVENAFVGGHVKPRPPTREALNIRRAEAVRAAGILGAARHEFPALKSYYFSREDGTGVYPTFSDPQTVAAELSDVVYHGLPPVLNAYTIPAARDRLLEIIRSEQPQVIFTHAPDDRHQDHYCVARVVSLLVDDLKSNGVDIEVWHSEPGAGGAMVEFRPTVYVELTEDDVRRKQEACACFPSQFDNDRRAYVLARCQAYGRIAGVPYAEAFCPGTWPRLADADGEAMACLAAGPQPPTVIRLGVST